MELLHGQELFWNIFFIISGNRPAAFLWQFWLSCQVCFDFTVEIVNVIKQLEPQFFRIDRVCFPAIFFNPAKQRAEIRGAVPDMYEADRVFPGGKGVQAFRFDMGVAAVRNFQIFSVFEKIPFFICSKSRKYPYLR